jgi:hypothetical protein
VSITVLVLGKRIIFSSCGRTPTPFLSENIGVWQGVKVECLWCTLIQAVHFDVHF